LERWKAGWRTDFAPMEGQFPLVEDSRKLCVQPMHAQTAQVMSLSPMQERHLLVPFCLVFI
jgi:hypothetical protein